MAKTFLRPDQRREIENEIKSIERMMNGADDNARSGVGYMKHAADKIGNHEDLQRELEQQKKHLANGTPKKFRNPQVANKALAWAKKAEKWIADHAPASKDTHVLFPNSKSKHGADLDFERSVQMQMEWMKKSPKVIAQYREIMQRLDPDNPNVRNIERLRR